MSQLKIPFLKELSADNPSSTVMSLLTSGVAIQIDKLNWKEYPHLVEAKVALGYDHKYLLLHYEVKDDLLKAVYRQDQEPVWQDSCVEFFIKQGELYRNFEFNALGVCLSASGVDRHARKSLDQDSLSGILRFPSLSTETLPVENTPADWSLTVAIPLKLIGLKAGDEFSANFYKCGDETAIPHYISWSEIKTANPDFHQPTWFGLAKLEVTI